MSKHKLMLPILAAIVGVAASAFTVVSKNTNEHSKAETTYWFEMAPDGTTVTTTQVSDPNSICPNQLTKPDCLREYNESQTEIVNGIRQVKASEVENEIDFRSKE